MRFWVTDCEMLVVETAGTMWLLRTIVDEYYWFGTYTRDGGKWDIAKDKDMVRLAMSGEPYTSVERLKRAIKKYAWVFVSPLSWERDVHGHKHIKIPVS